jgi:predicted flap endonuclease-1-like 5' DNA nuclease
VAAAELKSRQEALEEAQGQSKALQDELARVVAEKAGLEQQLQQHAADLEAITQRLSAAQAGLDQTAARRDELDALLKERDHALAGAEQKLNRVSRFEGALALAKNLETRHAGKTRAASAAFVAGRQPQLSGEPQAIGDVKGIGPVFQQRLYEAGVGTYWELANLSDEDFRDILKLDETEARAVDFDKIRSRALRLARESDSLGVLWDEHRVDDLETLPGMGDAYERRLYAAGVRTFEALAQLDEEQLAAIVRAPKMRPPDFGLWIAEARRLAQGEQAVAQDQTANGEDTP